MGSRASRVLGLGSIIEEASYYPTKPAVNPEPKALNPNPYTLNPEPEPLNPKP